MLKRDSSWARQLTAAATLLPTLQLDVNADVKQGLELSPSHWAKECSGVPYSYLYFCQPSVFSVMDGLSWPVSQQSFQLGTLACCDFVLNKDQDCFPLPALLAYLMWWLIKEGNKGPVYKLIFLFFTERVVSMCVVSEASREQPWQHLGQRRPSAPAAWRWPLWWLDAQTGKASGSLGHSDPWSSQWTVQSNSCLLIRMEKRLSSLFSVIGEVSYLIFLLPESRL